MKYCNEIKFEFECCEAFRTLLNSNAVRVAFMENGQLSFCFRQSGQYFSSCPFCTERKNKL